MGFTLTDVLLFGGAKESDADNAAFVIMRRNILRWGAIGGYVSIVVHGVPPLVLPDAIAHSLSYVKAFGGTEQNDTPAPDAPVDIVSNNGVLKARKPSGLPLGYTLLEYIESTGTQYMDIEISGNATFIGTAQSTTNSPTTSQVLVANGGAGAGRWFGVQAPSAGSSFAKRWGLGASSTASTTIYGTTKVDFNITFSDVDGQYGTVNNETVTRTSTIPTQGDWIAFAGFTTPLYGFIGKVWGLKVIQNDVLVRNLIPAKDSSNVVGMYDTVSGQFFTNAGTGDFVAGNPVNDIEIYADGTQETIGISKVLATGYTALEYIESTGTQFFNTGILCGAGVSVDMVVQGTGDRGLIFSFDQDYSGSYVGDTGTYFMGPNVFTGMSSLVKTDITTYWESEDSGLRQTTTINGVTKTWVYSRTPNTIELFKGRNWGTDSSFWAGKMFSFLLKRNGVAIRNFIPAKNASNVVGMYDTVSGQFFTNAGTGTFVAGPEAYHSTAVAEMLLKVGNYQDEQEILSGVVTRNVGVLVLTGAADEQWGTSVSTKFYWDTDFAKALNYSPTLCTHYQTVLTDRTSGVGNNQIALFVNFAKGRIVICDPRFTTVSDFKAFLADQYAAGTPVIVIYPLATPTTESVAGQTLQVQDGDNVLEITQASLTGLELEAQYNAAVSLTIQEVQDANLDNNVEVTIQ